jgi:hypothetical protein
MHIQIRTKEPAAGPATDQQGAVDHRESRVRKSSHRNVQASPVSSISEQRARRRRGAGFGARGTRSHARTAGLLGEHQQIRDAKKFRAAKKRLGITSRRDGFGRGGGRRRDALEQLDCGALGFAQRATRLDRAGIRGRVDVGQGRRRQKEGAEPRIQGPKRISLSPSAPPALSHDAAPGRHDGMWLPGRRWRAFPQKGRTGGLHSRPGRDRRRRPSVMHWTPPPQRRD